MSTFFFNWYISTLILNSVQRAEAKLMAALYKNVDIIIIIIIIIIIEVTVHVFNHTHACIWYNKLI